MIFWFSGMASIAYMTNAVSVNNVGVDGEGGGLNEPDGGKLLRCEPRMVRC